MTSQQLQDEVMDIIAAKGMVARDTLSADKKLTDLNISSLDVVEIVFALEDKFNIEIPFNANQSANTTPDTVKFEFGTVGQVVDAVAKLVSQKAA